MKNVRFECQKDDCCTKTKFDQSEIFNQYQNLNVQSHDFIIVRATTVHQIVKYLFLRK